MPKVIFYVDGNINLHELNETSKIIHWPHQISRQIYD